MAASLLNEVANKVFSVCLKKEQEQAINHILEGRDLVVNLPVGYGKSLIYQILPLLFESLQKPDKVLVISPLSSIMKDQVSKLELLSIKAVQLSQNCNVVGTECIDVLKAVKESKIIFCHPEAVLEAEKGRDVLTSLSGCVGGMIVDECHKVDDWGKEFRQSFASLAKLRSFFPDVPVACLSATLTKKQKEVVIRSLCLRNHVTIAVNPDKPNIFFHKVKKMTRSAIEDICNEQISSLKREGSSFPVTLVFLPLQHMAAAMQQATCEFGDMDINNATFGCIFSTQDAEVMATILKDLSTPTPRFRLIFCTSVVGMGFDPPSVEHVIHVVPPRSLTNFFQEIGRAGRRGQPCRSTLYYCARDIVPSLPGIQDDIINFCKDEGCLREFILNNFEFCKDLSSPKGCMCCSVCKVVCKCEECEMVNMVQVLDL